MEYLQQYEALDVVGTGSFGIIRKVRRVSDSVVRILFATTKRVVG